MDGDPFDLVGDVLDGQFRVDAFAGEGDLSVVYRGHHIGVDATVAIKCLNLPSTLDQALVQPLVESFREASRLHYRLARGNMNIAQSIAAGQTIAPRTGTTVPYLVREWFEGKSLSSELARRRAEGQKGRSVEEALALLEPAIDGMAYAHRKDVVHLAFSPSNLFLAKHDDTSSLKLLDFGVARALNELESDVPDHARPPAGLRVLFPAYAAPEQLDKSVGDVGPSTDVYAIALVLMEVLSDRIVMEGTETGVLVERALDRTKRPTPQAHGLHLPRNVELVLTRAVGRAPDKRQKDAGALWNDLKNAQRGTGTRSMPAPRTKAPTLSGVAPPPAPLPAVEAPPIPVVAPEPIPPTVPPPPGPPREPVFTLPTITAKLPPPMPAQDPVPQQGSLASGPDTPPAVVRPGRSQPEAIPEREYRVAARAQLSPAFIAVTASVAALLLAALVVLIVTWPKPRRASAMPVASAHPRPAAQPTPTAPPAVPTARAPATVPPPQSTARFSGPAAQRALNATARDVARCKKSTMWGIARATVTFANDGSVDHVYIGPPFTGTQTGQCVAEVMQSAHVPPFGGAPAVYITQFFVPMQ